MTPAPASHRSASVSASVAHAEAVRRSMTPNPSRTGGERAGGREISATATGLGNGSSAGGISSNGGGAVSGNGNGSSVPPLPSLPSLSGVGMVARPPVPPKPRTLSQSQGPGQTHPSPPRQGRGVVDDRDGYATEKEKEMAKKMGGGGGEEKKRQHQRWLPTALLGMGRPATSLGVRGEV